jgi:hypothetical protein
MRTKRAYNNPPDANRKKFSPSSVPCQFCGGCGFRPVRFRGLSAVTKCICRGGAVSLPGVDYKSLAAGER